jgi:preprotein translocase subunit SecE
VAKAVSNKNSKAVGRAAGKSGAKSAGAGKSLGAERRAAAKQQARQKARRPFRASARAARSGKTAERKPRGKFLRDVRVEMGKVSWPTRSDLLQSTLVVIVAVVIAAVYTAGLDTIFSRIVDFIVHAIS